MALNRRRLVAATSLAPVAAAAAGPAFAHAGRPAALPYPLVVDTSAAAPELTAFMLAFFAAKTRRDVDATMSFFSRDLVTYTDVTLGLAPQGFDALQALFAQFMPTWPDTAMSYPTRILGDMRSALVGFTDSPELFGGELRILGSIDFKDGKIVRWFDHWDSRGWPNQYGLPKTPVADFHTAEVGESASPLLRGRAAALVQALAAGDAQAAAAQFSIDAVLEDAGLRLQVQGRLAIERYLARALPLLPHGRGCALRHVVGSRRGGGFEWIGAAGSPVSAGVTALVLDGSGLVTRASSAYDAGLLSPAQMTTLTSLAIDP